MPQATKSKKVTKESVARQLEITRVYKQIYKELELLEVEGKELKKKVREIVDKVKTKNILEDIIKSKE